MSNKATRSKEKQEDEAFEAEVQKLAQRALVSSGLTVEQLSKPTSLRFVMMEMTSISVAVKHALRKRDDLIKALSERLAAVEAAPSMAYRGVWKSSEAYAKGTFVTSDGSLWHANHDVAGVEPGKGDPAWTLAVKRGRDARS
jgi:flagellar hook-basal body complex protein FliE